jgi:putative intracellular protease/amidase
MKTFLLCLGLCVLAFAAGLFCGRRVTSRYDFRSMADGLVLVRCDRQTGGA